MSRVADAWDHEYRQGRYESEPPVPFVDDIIRAASERHVLSGVNIGCGNGRNYIPLIEAGLDLVGLDVSGQAINQLRERLPGRQDRLIHGDLAVLPPEARYPLVVGLQVFQHGDRHTTHEHIRSAQSRLQPLGLMAVRVNHPATDIFHDHDLAERSDDGALTIRYTDGPRADSIFTSSRKRNLMTSSRTGRPSSHSVVPSCTGPRQNTANGHSGKQSGKRPRRSSSES